MTKKLYVIDGVTYREVERNAKVGEKIITVRCLGEKASPGDILTVLDVDCADDGSVFTDSGFFDTEIGDKYRVLEPVAPPQSDADIIANLVRRVAQLETLLDDALKNVHTFGEQTEANSADIRTLDARTQPLVALSNLFVGGDRQ